MLLTNEQREALDAGDAVEISVDEQRCIVIREDVYRRLRAGQSSGLPPEVVGALVEESMQEYDANDPLLESYQEAS